MYMYVMRGDKRGIVDTLVKRMLGTPVRRPSVLLV